VLDRFLQHEFQFAGIAGSPDGRGLVSAGNQSPTMWLPGSRDVQRLKPNAPPGGGGGAANVAADGRLSVHGDGGSVRVFSIPTGREGPRLTNARGYFQPGQLVASPLERFVAVVQHSPDQRIRLWNVATGKERAPLLIPRNVNGDFLLTKVAFSPDGRLLVAISSNGGVRVWEVVTGATRLDRIPEPGTIYSAAAFAHDGRTLILGTAAGSVRLLDVFTQADSGAILAHLGEVRSLAVAKDGRRMASGGADTTALVWDLPELVRRLPAKSPPPTATAEKLDLWWAYLGSNDPARSGEALRMFRHFPREALALFQARLKGVKAVDIDKLKKWIADLDSEKFLERDRALKGLIAAGDDARSPVEEALRLKPSEEAKRRLEQLLKSMTTGVPARKLQPLRAVALMEAFDDPAVLPLLEELAKHTTDEDVRAEIEWVLARKK